SASANGSSLDFKSTPAKSRTCKAMRSYNLHLPTPGGGSKFKSAPVPDLLIATFDTQGCYFLVLNWLYATLNKSSSACARSGVKLRTARKRAATISGIGPCG